MKTVYCEALAYHKSEVVAIVASQNWNDTPWPYVPTVIGSETNCFVQAKPKRRPFVILMRAVLFWDLHDLEHPTYTLNSRFEEETVYPGGMTFRDGKMITPNQVPEDTARKIADPQH